MIYRLERELDHSNNSITNTRDKDSNELVSQTTRDSELEALFGGTVGSPKSTITSNTIVPVESSSSNDGIVRLLQSQRDRFKERLVIAEREISRLSEELSQMDLTRKRLETDNLQLYERIKFLHNYSNKKTSTPLQLLEEGPASNDVEARYNHLYEKNVNPFTDVSHLGNQSL